MCSVCVKMCTVILFPVLFLCKVTLQFFPSKDGVYFSSPWLQPSLMTHFGRQSVAEAKLSQSQPRPPKGFEVLPFFHGPWCYHVDEPGGLLEDEMHGQALLHPC